MLSFDFLLMWKFCSFCFDAIPLPPCYRRREMEGEGNKFYGITYRIHFWFSMCFIASSLFSAEKYPGNHLLIFYEEPIFPFQFQGMFQNLIVP